jgi:hypothetical protein
MARFRFREDRRDSEQLEELRGALTLAREESSRLRVERQRELGLGRVTARLPELMEAGAAPDCGDDAAALLSEAILLRRLLLEITGEVERAMVVLRDRLQSGVPITELDRRTGARPTADPSQPAGEPATVPAGAR